jgi:hypothetical protein
MQLSLSRMTVYSEEARTTKRRRDAVHPPTATTKTRPRPHPSICSEY